MKLAMGVYDAPQQMTVYDAPQQREQLMVYLDLIKYNVAVFGGPMTGKTTFIKTLLFRLNQGLSDQPREDIFILDFGGNIGRFGDLPNVCACFDNSNEENIKRVFKVLETRLAENAAALGSESFASIAENHPDQCPAHLTLIIENLNAFLTDDRYSTYRDKLLRFCRDGLSKGMSIVFTANDTVGTNRILPYFGKKVAFEMPVDSYIEVFNTKVIKPMKLPGRGLFNLDSSVYEFQAFLPYKEETQFDRLCEKAGAQDRPNRLKAFPEVLMLSDCKKYYTGDLPDQKSGSDVLIGLDYYEQRPVLVNLTECRSIAIYGKRQFGKTNLLRLLLKGITASLSEMTERGETVRFVLLDDGRKQLDDKHLAEFHNTVKQNHLFQLKEYNNVKEFKQFLYDFGYKSKNLQTQPARHGAAPQAAARLDGEPPKPAAFTVFLLQSKALYPSMDTGTDSLMKTAIPDMVANAETRGYLFIFSDVKRIPALDMQKAFNSMISTAFLLDSIGDFVADIGSRSVFGERDARELKAEYAKCSLGDGYCYNVESDDLKKVKILKA